MAKARFAEYEAAKYEIIGGVEFKEETRFPNQWGMLSKQYHTEENGNFYEVTDPNTGVVEFWSDKHPESRYYQDYNLKRETAEEPQPIAEPEPQPEYGRKLAEEIRTNTEDFSKLSDYEKFILDRGFLYKTDEELKAGYDRAWKCGHDVLLTESEFVIEAGRVLRSRNAQKGICRALRAGRAKKM